MTKQLGEKKVTKKGTVATQVGGFLMVLGVILALLIGSFGAVPAVLLFGGLITLVVGVAQRDNDNT
jgi:hypothetical protein